MWAGKIILANRRPSEPTIGVLVVTTYETIGKRILMFKQLQSILDNFVLLFYFSNVGHTEIQRITKVK